MSTKPMISIDVDLTVRRSYALAEEAAKTIEAYAQFLTDRARRPADAKKKGKTAKATVSPGQVIAKLSEKLAKDPLFVEWQKTRKADG